MEVLYIISDFQMVNATLFNFKINFKLIGMVYRSKVYKSLQAY